jgi:hypothetical protein
MSEHALPADLDSEAHRPGCPHYGKSGPVPLTDETTAYLDLFCDCHSFAEPHILANKRDIAWPLGWDQEMANEWRRKNDLARPTAHPNVRFDGILS